MSPIKFLCGVVVIAAFISPIWYLTWLHSRDGTFLQISSNNTSHTQRQQPKSKVTELLGAYQRSLIHPDDAFTRENVLDEAHDVTWNSTFSELIGDYNNRTRCSTFHNLTKPAYVNIGLALPVAVITKNANSLVLLFAGAFHLGGFGIRAQHTVDVRMGLSSRICKRS